MSYRCNKCNIVVGDRRRAPKCSSSFDGQHDWKQTDFANDTKWSESLIGKHWLKILIIIGVIYLLSKLGVF
ncbi:MAG TPA: hypothetical protein PK784_05735 [Tenuifilaceae bacterium]|nr:hypothetical protein [Tenuifilaceae bacterium]